MVLLQIADDTGEEIVDPFIDLWSRNPMQMASCKNELFCYSSDPLFYQWPFG